MTTYNVDVATNVCGDLPNTIPVSIDCSLCALGFPMSGGRIGVRFFGPICPPATEPSPSYWLGYETKWAEFKCPDPGENAEPAPNTWVATGFFGGISRYGCGNKYRFDATLTALNPTQISVSVAVYVLTPTTGGNTWTPYISWSETLTEISGTDSTRYRGRSYASPNYVAISPAEVGGKGDPVSFAKMEVGLTSMRIGCGSTANAVPVCGFWDGTQWLTCLSGVIRSTSDYSKREFSQFGFNLNPCGGTSQPKCNCDTITLTSTSPVAGTTTYNTDATFVSDYGLIGVTGEAVGVKQQIQVSGGSNYGIKVVVKQVGSGSIYICTNDNGAGWVNSVATVAQAKGPRILTASRTGFDVWLYALNFPNDNLLPTECMNDGDIPTPDPETDPWWCNADHICVQSPLQPPGASGPYASEEECGGDCGGLDPTPPPDNPWWCVDGTCLQAPYPPSETATGPYASSVLCEGDCTPGETFPGWYCVYDDYYGSFAWTCRYFSDTPTVPHGLQFFNFAACMTDCPPSGDPSPPPPPDPIPPIEGAFMMRPTAKGSVGIVGRVPLTPELVRKKSKEEIAEMAGRFSGQCMHIGKALEDPATCGCNKHALLRKCKVYGTCRVQDARMEVGVGRCVTCLNYNKPIETTHDA